MRKNNTAVELSNKTRPWECQANESTRIYSAFLEYRDMGPDRTLTKMAMMTGHKRTKLQAMNHRYRWFERAEAWDKHLQKKADEAKIKAIEKMNARHTDHSEKTETTLMIPVQALIKKFNKLNTEELDNMNTEKLLNLVFQSADRIPKIMDSERKARGVPTEFTKSAIDHTSGGNPVIPLVNIIVNGSQSKLLEDLVNDYGNKVEQNPNELKDFNLNIEINNE